MRKTNLDELQVRTGTSNSIAMVAVATARSFFSNALPEARLGQAHDSLKAFRQHVSPEAFSETKKEYTLIVVTEFQTQRILLGRKHRGFGKGMFNSFGGKLEPTDESIVTSAMRELHEETGISVTHGDALHSVGTLHFTFADSTTEMMVHLFRLQIQILSSLLESPSSSPVIVPVCASDICGCDEITPEWFDDWTQVPLHNMFADDSIWLPYLLLSSSMPKFSGWFHFTAGGQETNTILHYYIETDAEQ
jgi:8-oxo-dGTP pyrophosphatase MutT (NUDIX family)